MILFSQMLADAHRPLRNMTAKASWGGRKGRTAKEVPHTDAEARQITTQASYANSHLFYEINSIVEKFTEDQRKLAEATGFCSFAKPLHAIQFDKQFIVWLLPKVDNMARSISVCPGKKLMIFSEDVAKVFGIPCRGKEVWDASLDKSPSSRKKIEGIIGMDENNISPRAAATKTILELAGRELSEEERNVFKVTFVVAIVCMLCDSNNPGEQESVNFWPALANPDAIASFNWSSYVLESVFSACVGSKLATRRNCAYMPPAGSALFLQVHSTVLFSCISFNLNAWWVYAFWLHVSL
jgi:hypothetical protein